MSRWTDAERATLARIYPDHTADECAAVLGRSRASVYQQAYTMRLRKSPEFLSGSKSGRMQPGASGPTRGRFQPGHKPWNKGVPGSAGLHVNSRRNWFQRGRRPQQARNYRPIGSLRVQAGGILQRKVTDDTRIHPQQRWRSEHSLVWEQHHGPVPAGHIVVFRPGMHTTERDRITPDRLECISRAENMRRNSVHQHPPELVDLYYLKASITRKVNQIRKESK